MRADRTAPVLFPFSERRSLFPLSYLPDTRLIARSHAMGGVNHEGHAGALGQLRKQIAECERLRQQAKSRIKRDIFHRLAAHYGVLAGELEKAIAESEIKQAGE